MALRKRFRSSARRFKALHVWRLRNANSHGIGDGVTDLLPRADLDIGVKEAVRFAVHVLDGVLESEELSPPNAFVWFSLMKRLSHGFQSADLQTRRVLLAAEYEQS